MSTVLVRPQARAPQPGVDDEPVEVAAPPPRTRPPASARFTRALMALPVLGGAAATALLVGRGGGPQTYLVAGLFGISAVAMVAAGWGTAAGGRTADAAVARRDYLRYLAGVRTRLRDAAGEQLRAAHHRHPDPRWLWTMVPGDRLWERRRGDPDFGEVRVGVGSGPLATPLRAAPAGAGEEPDPVGEAARTRLLDTYRRIDGLPLPLPLPRYRRIHLTGDPDRAAGVARAMVAHLASFHSPDDLAVAVCAGTRRRADWEWVKWLPHAQHPTRRDGAGPARLVAGSLAGLHERCGGELPAVAGESSLVVVREVDAARDDPPGATDGVLLLEVGHPPAGPPGADEAVLDLAHGGVRVVTGDGGSAAGVPDVLAVAEAELLARRLAPLRPAGAGPAAGGPGSYADLLGVDPDTFDPAEAWARHPAAGQLRVPIGTGVDGDPVVLDLKESAAGGVGPHGLLVGATGSGKSELLRAMVLGLAATHSSEDLNAVLVDFKGGATFADLDRLPHTAAVITNLGDELPLVDRMTDALNGELVRRQELLRGAGNHPSRQAYQRARERGAPLPPLPVLLIVCDEFSELLAARPDFTELFVQIGRLGRSLGVHLLLASQRLDEGRLRGLETHLSYRIALRTFSALESRAVLGVPDAYELPRAPGHGYLTSGAGELVRFTSAPVTSPAAGQPTGQSTGQSTGRPTGPGATRPGASGPTGGPGLRVLPYGTYPVAAPAAGPVEPDGRRTVADLLVSRLTGAGPPAHRVWLPPLSDPPRLTDLLGPLRRDPDRGLCVSDTGLHGALRVPVAVVDRPFHQRRETLWWQLSGGAGHAAVVGGPRTGRSTVVRTLLCALALTHTPAEVTAYCLDFGGGSLSGLRLLPHVGGVAGRSETAAVRRTVGELSALLAGREHRGPDRTGDPYGEVFLVVDGWATLQGEFEELSEAVADLAARGLSYGIHVVATAGRWLDFRPAVRDLFGSRLELRLGEPADSIAGHRAAAAVPEGTPGRGVTTGGLHLLTALPDLPGTDLVAEVAAAWHGPVAPPVRLLPERVPYQRIAPEPAGDDRMAGLRLPIGIGEADLATVALDLAADAHLLVFGDTESGKSSFLRSLATSLTRRFRPEQARIVLVDYRRSLLGTVTTEHLIGYGTTAEGTAELLESVAGYLRRRLPGPEVTAAQLRDRSWWTGPECVVLVDDYDLVTAGGGSPVTPLLPYLAQARDVGLHLVLARRTGGAGRAMYEPVLQRLRELAVPGLVMSGDPAEGALVGGVAPAPLPPGRAWLLTRRQPARLVQLADAPEAVHEVAPE